ncbi:MAG: hypothetical protein L3J93_06525 [Thermoplasmata archaeon]|nr:hypothetical protein [Thermoplasmata archaeon]
MDAEFYAIASSLLVLSSLLVFLTVRAGLQTYRLRDRYGAMWGSGLGLAAAAMLVESVVYLGIVSSTLLQLYVFLSAAIVGILSLGATKVLHSQRGERAYTAFILTACSVVAVACGLTTLPTSMVTGGIITGNPPTSLLILSSVVTVPATIVLLVSAGATLRRSWRWQTLLLVGGAIILGAGGTLYIASFPVALYYAEFLGIVLLFFGLVSLPHPSAAPTQHSIGAAAH